MNKIKKTTEEGGMINLALIAIALPIFALLFATVFDLARIPQIRSHLRSSVALGARSAEGAMAGLSEFVIQADTPASNNLCEFIGISGATCDISATSLEGKQGFFSSALSSDFVKYACSESLRVFKQDLRKNAVLNAGAAADTAFSFILVKFDVDRVSGVLQGEPRIVARSDDNCAGVGYSMLVSGGISAEQISDDLFNYFKERGSGGSLEIEAFEGDKKWLSQYFLIGVAATKVKFLMPKVFNMHDVITEYYVRTLGVASGFQAVLD